MISPPIDLSAFTAGTFLGMVDAFLADTAAQVSQPSLTLLRLIGDRQIHDFLDHAVPGRHSHIDAAATILPAIAGSGFSFVTALGLSNARRIVHTRKANQTFRLIQRFRIERPVNMLKDRERAVLKGMAALVAHRGLPVEEWAAFLAQLAWGDGAGHLVPESGIAADVRVVDARSVLKDLLTRTQPRLDVILGGAAARMVQQASGCSSLSPAALPGLTRGISWLSTPDVDPSPYLSTKRSPSSLFLGRAADTRTPIYFDGHESLITIGGPGSGKSQAQVIPNLLTYPGSAIVLDVKGELWEQTAGHRQATFGPVFRFAPTDTSGRTHCYNPFDHISRDPEQAALDCEVFAYQIIAEKPDLKDPYWENRGRDFLWAFATTLALTAPDAMRRMERLAELSAIPTEFPDLTAPAYLTSDTARLIQLMGQLAVDADIPDLNQAANALYAGLREGQRLTSVLDNARRYLSPFARSKSLRRAMSRSHWSPMDLRTRPGTTVYLCIPTADLQAYAPFLRLIFAQHVRILTRHLAKPGEPPVTIFLDEMPQLGKFDDVMRLQDVGRGAGIRLWMFAQYLGQIRAAYGQNRAHGLLEANRIRCFLQPDSDTATVLQKTLGDVTNELTGERRPLATLAELTNGPQFTDKIITSVRGHRPIVLDKHEAWRKMGHLIKAPPVVPIAPDP